MPDFDAHRPVVEALTHLRDTFGTSRVWARDDGSHGLFVKIEGLELSPSFLQEETWMGFQISRNVPRGRHLPSSRAARFGSPLGCTVRSSH